MAIPTFICVFCLVLFAGAMGGVVPSVERDTSHLEMSTAEMEGLEKHLRLHLLGVVELKAYFVDNTTEVTWTQAKKFCDDVGMQLATVKSRAEYEFLVSKRDVLSPGPIGAVNYWLYAMVRLSPDAYEWQDTRTPVVAFGSGMSDNPVMNLAWTASSWSGYNGSYYVSRYYVLCESVAT